MNNRTAFAKPINVLTKIEHNMCGRRAALIIIVVMTLFSYGLLVGEFAGGNEIDLPN